MVQEVRDIYGFVGVLVNNAVGNIRSVGFLDLGWEEVQRDMDVILKGAFHCCKAVIPGMVELGRGKIVNTSTVATDDPPPWGRPNT